MKKWFVWICLGFIFVLQGCSSEYEEPIYEDDNQTVVLADESTPERKIIYQVDLNANVSELDDAIALIKSFMNDDEWFDQEIIHDHSANFVIRIKSDRLDTFIDQLTSEFSVESYQMIATDISLGYQDKTNQIVAIDAQIERLIELYDQASLTDMIMINEQLSHLETERRQLQGELNVFDSLADYSEVNLTLYQSVVQTESPFINRLGRAFSSGWNGLVDFVQGFILLIATMLPFLVVMGSIAGMVILYIKKRNKKLDLLKQKQQ